MKKMIKSSMVGLALMVSGTGFAAKPAANADAGCAVLPPAEITGGLPYSVKVVRTPSYPGGWSRPTITVEVTYPTTPGHDIGDSREQTLLRHNVTYALAGFTVPETLDPDTNDPIIVTGGTAKITAVVREPINKRKFRETICTATTTVY
jgi:hypothetical protein